MNQKGGEDIYNFDAELANRMKYMSPAMINSGMRLFCVTYNSKDNSNAETAKLYLKDAKDYL